MAGGDLLLASREDLSDVACRASSRVPRYVTTKTTCPLLSVSVTTTGN
jgi:hypothetical protein